MVTRTITIFPVTFAIIIILTCSMVAIRIIGVFGSGGLGCEFEVLAVLAIIYYQPCGTSLKIEAIIITIILFSIPMNSNSNNSSNTPNGY